MKCEEAAHVSNVSCFCLLAQQCPFIIVDKNVLVKGDPEEATYGNVIQFSCKSKLDILEGSKEIYCNEEGEWSGRPPKCIGKACRKEGMMDTKTASEKQKFSAKYPAVTRYILGSHQSSWPSWSSDARSWEVNHKPNLLSIYPSEFCPWYQLLE